MSQERWHTEAEKLAEVRERFLRLYVPAVCDVLDDHGLRFQAVSPSIVPLADGMEIAGPAFTVLGAPSAESDPQKRIGPGVIDEFQSGVVACYDTQGDTSTGVWGELWSLGAAYRGCVGAVVDGAIRDAKRIVAQGFPIFHTVKRPTDALGRFTVVESQCAVTIGGVRVHPGDYIFGDVDGVVVIPSDLTLQVLEEAEALVDREHVIRKRLQGGESPADVYREFGKL